MPCWKNCKQHTKIHFLYRTCSNFNPIPFHHRRKKNERIWCLKPPCEKSRALNKEKGILREYSRIFSPCLPCTPPFFFISRNYSTVFIFFILFNKFLLQLRWHCFAHVLGALYSNSLFLMLCSFLLSGLRQRIVLFFFCGEGGLGLISGHNLYKKWIFWLFLAVLPTWHETEYIFFVVLIQIWVRWPQFNFIGLLNTIF